MARTKRQPVKASDVRRMGGQPLELTLRRTWVEYAANIATGTAGLALDVARKAEGDVLTVLLPERDTAALVELCEARGRLNTAEAFRSALKVALQPPEELDPLAHLQMLADLGELEPDELEMLRGAMAKREAASGKELF